MNGLRLRRAGEGTSTLRGSGALGFFCLLLSCSAPDPFDARRESEELVQAKLGDRIEALRPFMGKKEFLGSLGVDGVPDAVPPSCHLELDLCPFLPGKERAIFLNGCGGLMDGGRLFVFCLDGRILFKAEEDVYELIKPVSMGGREFLLVVSATRGCSHLNSSYLSILESTENGVHPSKMSPRLDSLHDDRPRIDPSSKRLTIDDTRLEIAMNGYLYSGMISFRGHWLLEEFENGKDEIVVKNTQESYGPDPSNEGDRTTLYETEITTYRIRRSEKDETFHVRTETTKIIHR